MTATWYTYEHFINGSHSFIKYLLHHENSLYKLLRVSEKRKVYKPKIIPLVFSILGARLLPNFLKPSPLTLQKCRGQNLKQEAVAFLQGLKAGAGSESCLTPPLTPSVIYRHSSYVTILSLDFFICKVGIL